MEDPDARSSKVVQLRPKKDSIAIAAHAEEDDNGPASISYFVIHDSKYFDFPVAR